MARLNDKPKTFAAMERIRSTALKEFDSLFTPGQPIWSMENLTDFQAKFVEQPDEGTESFFDKFHKQLQDASEATLQLAAELLYVQQFFTMQTNPATKLENVRKVLGWMKA